MKNLISKLAITLLVIISFSACKKIENGEPVLTANAPFIQEGFVPENGGSGNASQGTCQCVKYVKSILGINTATANAKDWGVSYTPAGYSLVNGQPQVKDIIVLTPDLGSVWSTTNAFLDYGHIAIVSTISVASNGDYNLKIRGSNQGAGSIDCECNNVSEKSFTLPVNKFSTVRFYRKSYPVFACGLLAQTTVETKIISITGDLTFGNVAIGSQPSRQVTITNNGNAALNISSISVPNGYGVDWQNGQIASGQSKTINIIFTPLNTVSIYNGTMQVLSDATSGSGSLSVTGAGINIPSSGPAFSPTVGSFTSCGFNNITGSGNCSGTYIGGIIKLKAASFNQITNTVTFNIQKCSGSFTLGGTAYIKTNGYCSSVVAQVAYAANSTTIAMNVTPSPASGVYNYTCVLVSSSSEKFYSQPVTVTY